MFVQRGGDKSHFVHFTKEDAHGPLLQGRRKRIVFDGALYFLLFVEGCIHEVDAKIPNASIYLSGFNPADPVSAYPARTAYARQCYHPPEYTDALSNRDSERLGLLYLAPGKYWPSLKQTYQLANVQALGVWYDRVLPRYQQLSVDEKKNVRYLLPNWGTVQHTPAAMEAVGMDALPAVAYTSPAWVMDPIARYADKPLLQWRRGLRKSFSTLTEARENK